MAEEPQVGFVTMGEPRRRGRHPVDRDRHARLRLHGQGAHERAQEDRVHDVAAAVHAAARRDQRAATRRRSRRPRRRYGYEKWTTDWRDVVDDPDVQVFDNGGPNDVHLEPTIAAAKAGKHIICEKPLGRTADESFEIWKGVAATGVKAHDAPSTTASTRRSVLAKQMIDAGELGEIYHFRGRYHQEWIMDPEFPKVWRLDKSGRRLGRARRPRCARDRPVALPRRRARPP